MDPDARKWLDHLAAAKGASPHTLRAYGADLRSLAQHLGRRRPDRRLRDATRRELRSWLASLGSPGSRPAPASLARRVATLRGFYAWLVVEGQLAQSPAARIRPPRVPRRVPRILEVPEAAGVVENPPQQGVLALRNRALLELVYSAGLRVGELVALDRGDVDADERAGAEALVLLVDDACHDQLAGSGELLDLHWVALEEATKLDLPNITRMIVQIALDRMALPDPFDPTHKVPFFFFHKGKPQWVEIE